MLLDPGAAGAQFGELKFEIRRPQQNRHGLNATQVGFHPQGEGQAQQVGWSFHQLKLTGEGSIQQVQRHHGVADAKPQQLPIEGMGEVAQATTEGQLETTDPGQKLVWGGWQPLPIPWAWSRGRDLALPILEGLGQNRKHGILATIPIAFPIAIPSSIAIALAIANAITLPIGFGGPSWLGALTPGNKEI